MRPTSKRPHKLGPWATRKVLVQDPPFHNLRHGGPISPSFDDARIEQERQLKQDGIKARRSVADPSKINNYWNVPSIDKNVLSMKITMFWTTRNEYNFRFKVIGYG